MLSDLRLTYSYMADEDLLAIVHSHMSFQPGAQDLARVILLQRGLSAKTINEWRHPDAEFLIRSWLSGKSVVQLRQMLKRRRRLDKITFYLLMIVNVVLLGIFLYLTLFNNLANWKIRREILLGFCRGIVFFLWLRIIIQSLSFRTPMRILFLRPFMFSDSRRRTRRFAKHYLRYWGHTYTMSDTEIKQRWAIFESLQTLTPILLAILIGRELFSDVIPKTHEGGKFVFDILGLLLFDLISTGWLYLFFRPSFNIRCDADVSRFKDFMGRKRARNIAWALSWDKLFKITCTPQTWKYTVQQLINSSQLVIVDLSRVGENMMWELEELRFYNAINKVVFMAHEESAHSARTYLASSGPDGFNGELFVYKENGLVARHEQLIDMLTSIAAFSLTAKRL